MVPLLVPPFELRPRDSTRWIYHTHPEGQVNSILIFQHTLYKRYVNVFTLRCCLSDVKAKSRSQRGRRGEGWWTHLSFFCLWRATQVRANSEVPKSAREVVSLSILSMEWMGEQNYPGNGHWLLQRQRFCPRTITWPVRDPLFGPDWFISLQIQSCIHVLVSFQLYDHFSLDNEVSDIETSSHFNFSIYSKMLKQ